jgi:hypothetical protein
LTADSSPRALWRFSLSTGYLSSSPLDLLEEFSKVYIVTDGEQGVISEIPRRVAELDKTNR